MRSADFDYPLPPELIAQHPAPERDGSRLLLLHRATGALEHRHFPDLLEYLRPGDLLVLNNSRVLPARLQARDVTGRTFEVLLLEETAPNEWWTMMRPGKKALPGTRLQLIDLQGQPNPLHLTVQALNESGHRHVRFDGASEVREQLEGLGEMPLPPYIKREGRNRDAADAERYQTVFARVDGSVAAPTAGLHFTPRLLGQARRMGVEFCEVTLHVGPGTFAPVKTDVIQEHVMHEEPYWISEESAERVNRARREGRRVIAVGTTAMRVLESSAQAGRGQIEAGHARTRIFIRPPCHFEIVDALLTNFHLPRSTLLMLVSAFAAPDSEAGRDVILRTYAEAVAMGYRFFSYGDATLIL